MREILAYHKKYDDYDKHFSTDDSRILIATINRITHGYITYLEMHFPALTEDDLCFCCLYLLGFKVEEMAVLLKRERSGIYKREKRLLTTKMGSPSPAKGLQMVLRNIAN